MILNPVDFKNFIYCKRQIYFKYILNLDVEPTEKMLNGKMMHLIIKELEERRSLSKYNLDGYSKRFDVKLYSEKLKISGVIDMIIENKNDAIPVDFKTNEPINYTAYILQLYSYSLLLEDVLGKSSSYGFILFTSTKKLTRIEYDYEIKDLFQKIYLEIVDIIKSERFPEPSFLHCDGCEYLNFCGDIK